MDGFAPGIRSESELIRLATNLGRSAATGAVDGKGLARALSLENDGEWVYFLTELTGPFVKIGRSGQPRERMAQAQCYNPRPLVLDGLIGQGDSKAVEKALHYALEEAHVRGEWFEATSDVHMITQEFGVEKCRCGHTVALDLSLANGEHITSCECGAPVIDEV